jgi:hypothetical protein
MLLSLPQNTALDCIYIRLHKYSVKIPIITIALELSLHYHGPLKCKISTPLISVSRICVVHIHQMLCKACQTHYSTLNTSKRVLQSCGVNKLWLLASRQPTCQRSIRTKSKKPYLPGSQNWYVLKSQCCCIGCLLFHSHTRY